MPKKCNKCNEVKQDNEFHDSQYGDGLNWWCKGCQSSRWAEYYRNRKPITSTEIAKAELLKRHIIAVDGGKVSMPYVDLSVWAAIPVEAKLSRLKLRGNSERFSWTFTPKQARNTQGFVFLIAQWNDEYYECFIIPRRLLKKRDDGTLKSVVATVGAESWNTIKSFQDRYDYFYEPIVYLRTPV